MDQINLIPCPTIQSRMTLYYLMAVEEFISSHIHDINNRDVQDEIDKLKRIIIQNMRETFIIYNHHSQTYHYFKDFKYEKGTKFDISDYFELNHKNMCSNRFNYLDSVSVILDSDPISISDVTNVLSYIIPSIYNYEYIMGYDTNTIKRMSDFNSILMWFYTIYYHITGLSSIFSYVISLINRYKQDGELNSAANKLTLGMFAKQMAINMSLTALELIEDAKFYIDGDFVIANSDDNPHDIFDIIIRNLRLCEEN